MIRVELSTEPLEPGGSRKLKAWSEAAPTERMAIGGPEDLGTEGLTPMSVAIECFVEPPKPPQLRPCPSCGEFRLANGEPILLNADEDLFKTGGFLKITIVDLAGDKIERRIVVSKISGSDRGIPLAR
jgi:hypothetical protein